MNKNFFYIANWKMQWTFNETIMFATQNYDGFVQLAQNHAYHIVLCPSYPALYPLVEMFKSTMIEFGAQDCSDHTQGAFTGQVSALHIKSVGCSYCIIGHSERRQHNGETSTAIAKKALQLISAGITPILCIGETDEQKRTNQTLSVLNEQLEPVFRLLKDQKERFNQPSFLIAYEPVWAIGTNAAPSRHHLETIFAWITQITQHYTMHVDWHLVYGGSVTMHTLQEILSVPALEGLLIGGASLDFQEFEKIVKYDK
jgi:triosephosphate isomerase (TIM)